MAIRYDKKIEKEINKVIRNFNQKIRRLEKEEKKLLPKTITKKEIKENVYNRNELRRKLNELKRFSKRGAEEIVTLKSGEKTTKYELENIKRESARIKRNISKEIKNLEKKNVRIFGKEQAATFSEMGDTYYLNLQAQRRALEKNINKLKKDELQRYKNLIKKISQNREYMNEIFKESYLKMLTELGYYFEIDNRKLEKIKEKIMTLNVQKFLKLFNEDKAIKSILDYYIPFTKDFTIVNYEDIKEDVANLYEALYESIDEIVKNA